MLIFKYLLPIFCLISNVFSLKASIYPASTTSIDPTIFRIEYIIDKENALAYADYDEDLATTGWDQLRIFTNKKFNDEETSYAAGYLEGVITKNRIANHYQNMADITWKGKEMPENVNSYFKQNRDYIINQFNSNPNDDYWGLAYLTQRQFDGLVNGYNDYSIQNKISNEDFHTMTSFGDIFDIVYYKNSKIDFFSLNVNKIQKYIYTNNHCSALIKVASDFSDIYFGHNSWFLFTAATRIFKEYHFDFHNKLVKSKSVMFSSYPATLASMDDYYITSSDLAVIETTNPMFNSQLYEKLTPNSLLCWHRAMLANRIAVNSKQWTEVFAKENSGTYNNQFMALDLKQIDLPNKKINENALWIIEQIPGYVESADVSNYLYDHWPSYNVPFFENIRNLSSITDMLIKHPELESSLSYNKCARAQIFKRDNVGIKDIVEFQRIMRYNDYKNDPLSLNKPQNAIASRMDLDVKKPICMGAYDAKVSSYKTLKQNHSILIIAGPSSDDQPGFRFSNSTSCNDKKRLGLPDLYKFNWTFFSLDIINNITDNSFLKYLE